MVNRPDTFFNTDVPPPGADGGRDVVFFRKTIDGPVTADGQGAIGIVNTSNTNDDGVTRRKMTLRGGHEGQADGTLELEIRRAPASGTR